jgi:hypothetical protein
MILHHEPIFGLVRMWKLGIDRGGTKELIRGPTEDMSHLEAVSAPTIGPGKDKYLEAV